MQRNLSSERTESQLQYYRASTEARTGQKFSAPLLRFYVLFSRIVSRINEGHSPGASKSHLDNNLRIFRPRIMRVPSRKHEHTPRTQLHPFTFIKALPKRIPVIPA